MEIRINRKGFYKIIKAIFEDVAEIKKGCPILIPICSSHQIYLNEIMIFLDEDKKHWLSVNSYGQLSIDTEDHRPIHFNLKQLNSISFLAQSITREINENNGRPYNEMYRFELY